VVREQVSIKRIRLRVRLKGFNWPSEAEEQGIPVRMHGRLEMFGMELWPRDLTKAYNRISTVLQVDHDVKYLRTWLPSLWIQVQELEAPQQWLVSQRGHL
jgi:hypothetical protein